MGKAVAGILLMGVSVSADPRPYKRGQAVMHEGKLCEVRGWDGCVDIDQCRYFIYEYASDASVDFSNLLKNNGTRPQMIHGVKHKDLTAVRHHLMDRLLL